jgi:MFS family permease
MSAPAISVDSADEARFPTRLFLFVFFGWTFDFYDLVLLGFLREPVSHALSLGHHEERWMLGVALATSGLGGIVSGRFADRFDKRTVLSVTILLYSLGSLVAGLAPNAWVFILGRALVGLGVGGEWAVGHGMLAEAVAPRIRGRASAALQAGEPVGVAIAALAGFIIMPLIGWRAVMIASSATALLAFYVRKHLHVIPPPPKKEVALSELFHAGIGSRFVRAWLLGVFKLGTYWTCYTWLPTFLKEHMHQTTGKSVAWVLTAQVGQFCGMVVFGQVADRVGRRPAFAVFSFLTAAALAPLAFRWEWLSDRPAAFWAVMLLLGFGSGCTAGFGALLAELYPNEIRGVAMGATYNLARAVQLGAPVLVGYAVDAKGLAGGLSVPLGLAIATGTWVFTLPETRGAKLRSLGEH